MNDERRQVGHCAHATLPRHGVADSLCAPPPCVRAAARAASPNGPWTCLEALEPRLLLAGEDVLTILNPVPGANDHFGSAIAAVGADMIVVGATDDDEAALDAGAAYVFDRDSGGLLHTLLSPAPASGDQFGFAVAAVGQDKVLIGAPRDDTQRVDGGAAYLFDLLTDEVVHSFFSPDPQPRASFGSAVAGAGDGKLLIGAYNHDLAIPDVGAAFLFDALTGDVLQTLMNPTPTRGDQFGFAVAEIDATTVAVGAPGKNAGATNTGAAYLFDSATGTLQRTLANPTPDASDSFGYAMSRIGANQLLVIAPNESSTAPFAGAAYLFNTGSGNVVHTFDNPAPNDLDFFGRSVAAGGGSSLLIGAASDDSAADNAGAAYLFDAGSGTLTAAFLDPNPDSSDQFGFAAADAGSERLAISANNDNSGAVNAGAVYIVDTQLPPP